MKHNPERLNAGNPTNYITKGILTETEQRFSNMKWFLNFLGSTIEDEPEFSKFFENEIGGSLMLLQISSRGALSTFPLLVRDVDQMMRRMLMLGYYLGGRRFDRGMMNANDHKSEETETITPPTGEVSEADFREDPSAENESS